MVEQAEILVRGGIYLAKLNPVKAAEVGKVRPIIILNSQIILDIVPPVIFVCPLSSQSQPKFESLHVKLPARDNLKVTSYALVEHCRSITTSRIIHKRLAQVTSFELSKILHQLQRLIDL